MNCLLYLDIRLESLGHCDITFSVPPVYSPSLIKGWGGRMLEGKYVKLPLFGKSLVITQRTEMRGIISVSGWPSILKNIEDF